MTRATVAAFAGLVFWGGPGCRCDRNPRGTPPASAPVSSAPSTATAPSANKPPPGAEEPWPELTWYRWVRESLRPVPKPVDTVRQRLPHSLSGGSGFVDEPESWTEWLRLLPLAAPGTPVRNYRGEVIVPGEDEHLAAVVALDVGERDLQQSADVVLRLHAEWRWFVNDLRMMYRSDTGVALPLERWRSGDRLVTRAGQPTWERQAAPKPKLDYADFRAYLDSVFAWSDARALLAESAPLAPEALAPGAFFLHQGPPAQLLVVLDVAANSSGKRAMLLAQALNPAENLHVLRYSRDSAWFPVRPDQPVRVPRVRPYSWKELRRLQTLRSRPEVECIGSLCPQGPPAPATTD